jgi:hypothetical protein
VTFPAIVEHLPFRAATMNLSPQPGQRNFKQVGCGGHTRRNFFDARLSQPREVHHALGLNATA